MRGLGFVGVPATDTVVDEFRPYQAEAVTAVAEGLSDHPVGQLHAACGSGKTLIAQRAAEWLLPSDGLIVVLVPTVALVAQTLTVWRRCQHVAFEALAVCSDDTVADPAVHVRDLDVPVTTDPGEIAAWSGSGGRRLIVSTYISAVRAVVPALAAADRQADVLICDEAHHLSGRVEHVTRRLVEPGFLPARRRLYMTATPRVNSARTEDSAVLSMDDEAVFGPVLYSYPFPRAIAEGYLEDYRLAVVGIADSEVRALARDEGREYVDRPGGQDLRMLVAQVALARARELYGVRRTITFHPRIAAAQEFARTLSGTLARLPSGGGDVLTARCIHGEMDSRQRKLILEDLRHPPGDGWTVISNARCLSEGVDVPAVDSVLFAHPKRSAVDVVQAVGRALRRAGSARRTATVIVPLVVPDTDGEIGDLDPGDYATLWQVVRALRAHDEPLGAELDHHRASDHTDNPQLPSKITMVMPPSVSEKVLARLRLLLVRQTTSPWWEGLAAARAFHAEHGHLGVDTRYVTGQGYRLGSWISLQRKGYARGWLRKAHVEELEKLGMVWDAFDARFTAGLMAARAFYTEHGHLNIPQSHQTEDGFKLGSWLSNQRQRHRRGELPADRIRALEEAGVVWRGIGWDRGLAAARAFHAEHGHLKLPQGTIYHGMNLSAWIQDCRNGFRDGSLDPERAEILESLGVVWNPHDDRWERSLAAARAFHAEHGHLQVPKGCTVDDVNLHTWVLNRRRDKRAGALSSERVAALDELGFVWDHYTDEWQRGLSAAQDYYATYGHLRPPPKAWHKDVQISAWVIRQRKEYRQGKLTEARVAALDEIGMQWVVPRGRRR